MLIDFFAGNFKSGKIKSQSMYFANKEEAESAEESILDELLTAVGYENGIWAVYTDGKSVKEHARDFGQFIDHYRIIAPQRRNSNEH